MADYERLSQLFNVYGPFLLIALATFLALETLFRSLARRRREAAAVNNRLKTLEKQGDNHDALIELRRQRGLAQDGGYILPVVWLNRLIVQSGRELRPAPIIVYFLLISGACVALARLLLATSLFLALPVGSLVGAAAVILFLVSSRSRRLKKIEEQLPDAIDVMVRSIRAGHPIPVAIAMVGREMPDPVGSEIGLVGDEMNYGLDLATAMGNLRERTGQMDVALLVVAVTIQARTGGNLAEILSNLSRMIRERYRVRRKIHALSAEGRFSSIALSVVPLAVYLIVSLMSPKYYGDVKDDPVFMPTVYFGAFLWVTGTFWLRRMVNFKI